MLKPEISVISSVYNGEKYLKKSLESILDQTYSNFEFIIVNDGSKDKTKLILNNLAKLDKRITIINNKKNLGLSNSLNKAIKVSKGQFIARHDCDDYSCKERLKIQIEYLIRNKDIDVIGSNSKVFNNQNKYLFSFKMPRSNKDIRCYSYFGNPFLHPTVMIRKKIFLGNKILYNKNYLTSQDYELWVQILTTHKGYNLNQDLVYITNHKKQTSKKKKNLQKKNSINILFSIQKNKKKFNKNFFENLLIFMDNASDLKNNNNKIKILDQIYYYMKYIFFKKKFKSFYVMMFVLKKIFIIDKFYFLKNSINFFYILIFIILEKFILIKK